MSTKWTDREVNALKLQEGQTKPRDTRENSGDGFGLTIFPSGEKSFIYIYHFQGRKRRMTLGKYPQCSLSDARKLHREALKVLESGKDPAFEKRKEIIIARDASTVDGLIDEYLEKWAKPNKRSWKSDESYLNNEVRPCWGKRKACDISRRDVILVLDKIKERGAATQANRVLSCIKKMFNFGIERDLISINPCFGIKPEKEKRCDRVLSDDELRILWLALDQQTNQDNPLHIIHMSPETKLVLKLQLVLAQRKGEVVSAEWTELDLTTFWWTIPAAKAKNNQTHRVPLPSLAIDLLREVKKLSNDSRFLFPSKKQKDSHITGASIDHAVRRSTFNGVNAWTPHDCRRTAASFMTSLGISRLVVSKILNHVDSTITSIYDRHSYDKEKRDGLELWTRKLKEIIYGVDSSSNVIAFKQVI